MAETAAVADMSIPIAGPPSADHMQAWLQRRGAHRRMVDHIALAIWGHAVAHGIDPVIVCQSALETGWGHYPGQVRPASHNTCGLRDRSGRGFASFPDWTTGALAHIQHLARYAGVAAARQPQRRSSSTGVRSPEHSASACTTSCCRPFVRSSSRIAERSTPTHGSSAISRTLRWPRWSAHQRSQDAVTASTQRSWPTSFTAIKALADHFYELRAEGRSVKDNPYGLSSAQQAHLGKMRTQHRTVLAKVDEFSEWLHRRV